MGTQQEHQDWRRPSYKEQYKAEGGGADKEKRWEDNISEWTGLALSETTRKAEDHAGWRELVARCVNCPNGRQATKGEVTGMKVLRTFILVCDSNRDYQAISNSDS